MDAATRPLIVGAGPVGLAAALFLHERGVATRIVDMALTPSPYSKALAINPRTLELLKPTGVTAQLLEIGVRVGAACLWRGAKLAAELDIASLPHEFPFMLALSQAATERALTTALAARGVSVERGVQLTGCRNDAGSVIATLQSGNGNSEEVRVPWLLAADGAHSTARRQLKMEFPGSTFHSDWYLADAPVESPLAEDRAHAFLLERGEFLFLIRVVDPALQTARRPPIWRLIGNRPNPLTRLVVGRVVGEAIWSSSFRVAHRLNRSMTAGQVYFAGDAAHIHSPVGARGMNLGIEDAWVFAALAQSGELSRYNVLRRPIDRGVVRRVAMLSRVVACEPAALSVLRYFMPLALRLKSLRRRMISVFAGVDHPLEGIPLENPGR